MPDPRFHTNDDRDGIIPAPLPDVKDDNLTRCDAVGYRHSLVRDYGQRSDRRFAPIEFAVGRDLNVANYESSLTCPLSNLFIYIFICYYAH